MPKSFNKYLKKYCVLTISVLVFLLVFAYFTLPNMKKISDLKDQMNVERKNLEELYLQGQSVKKAQESYNLIRDEVNQLNNAFLSPGDELGLITTLEKTANQNNLRHNLNLNSTKIIKTNGLNKMPLSINLTGSYSDILSYLQDIEALDLYIKFDQINMSRSPGKTSHNNIILGTQDAGSSISIDLSGNIYYIEAPETE